MLIKDVICRIDDLVIYMKSSESDKGIDAYLYKAGVSDNVHLQLWLTNYPSQIKIQNLFGNGDTSEFCNKGYGSILVQCTFDYVKNVVFKNDELETVYVSGDMVDLDSENPEASHSRRKHFWEKMGLDVSEDRDSLGGALSGTLRDITPSNLDVEWVSLDKLPFYEVERRMWEEHLHWNDSDTLLLERLNKFDVDVLIDCKTCLSESRSANPESFNLRVFAFQLAGAICLPSLFVFWNDFSVVFVVITCIVGFLFGGVLSTIFPRVTRTQVDCKDIEEKNRALTNELNQLLSDLGKHWSYFKRLNRKSGGLISEFLTNNGNLKLNADSDMVSLDEFFRKTRQCL
ncbi:hypothetical protein AAIA71_28605 (plasmid) [Vibrio harveyi]|uniref:hypothetical protein n=1 Tax=Vibrio harveyi TaxID=669 RepID=UPI0031BB5E52